MAHTIQILKPFDAVSHIVWVYVDGDRNNRYPLPAETEEDVDTAIAALYARLDEADRRREEEAAARPKRYRKIVLKAAIANIGKLPALNAWLASFEVAPGYSALEAWADANEIATDYPGFAEFYGAAKSALGVTDEQAAAILAAAEIAEG